MTAERVFQLVLIFVLVLVGTSGQKLLAVVDIRRLQHQRKESYKAGTAAITCAPVFPAIALGTGFLLLPWYLISLFGYVPTEIETPLDLLGTIEIKLDFNAYVERFQWIPTLIGWALIISSVLYVLFSFSKRLVVEKGSATFYQFFLPRQAVRIEDIAVVKERYRRARARVLPVYQCVYDVYVKAEGGQKKVYTLSNALGGVRFLRDCAALNKVDWKSTTPKRYARNPLIFPDLTPAKVPTGTNRQDLYLLTIPTLLTRQMINNNLPVGISGEK